MNIDICCAGEISGEISVERSPHPFTISTSDLQLIPSVKFSEENMLNRFRETSIVPIKV